MKIPRHVKRFVPAFFLALLLGCRSTDGQGEFTVGIVDPGAPTMQQATGPKIIVTGAGPNIKKEEIVAAIQAATRKLGAKNSATGADDARGAGMAADEILAGRDVVLEGFSQEQANQVVQDLKTAGLNVRTTK